VNDVLTSWNEDLVSVESAGTLAGLFLQRVERSPERPAYRNYDRDSSSWRDYSWREIAEQVARWQAALAQEGLRPGDRVAIQLRNCPEWVVFDQACLGLQLVTVPLYTDDNPDNIAYILEDAAVKLLLVQDAGRWKRLLPELPEEGPLRRVLLLDSGTAGEGSEDERVRHVSRWLPEGGGTLQRHKGNPHALATIVYTSGTTGRPKGVMLSHHNILAIAHAGVTAVDCYREDLFLSFLPLSHTLERTAGYYLPVMTGSAVAFGRSVNQLADDLQAIRPTVMITVPRVLERIYARIQGQLAQKSAIARGLFALARRVGWNRFLYQQGRGRWMSQLLLWPLLERAVARKIAARLGGRMRAVVSGGAALAPEIARSFIGLGIPLLQGYGLTETSPVVSVNPLQDNDPTSVGVPLRGVEVSVGENDELLVKGPGVMLGYWNNHAATAATIDSDGWLHTGDQARIENGHIYITGRIKEILVLSNGEKVPPVDMELAILLDPLFEQVMVIGEGRSYLSALVVLNADLWPGLVQDYGLNPLDPAAIADERISAEILRRIRVALHDFPGFAKIRRVLLTLEPWTIENGLMTPTLKAKRAKIVERFAKRIDSLYSSGPG
jgi:long-chain acyl-CoA synthetase